MRKKKGKDNSLNKEKSKKIYSNSVIASPSFTSSLLYQEFK
jgi:hypothetical protein